MTTATQTTQAVPTGTWNVDDTHSSANFEVEHGGLSVFRGGFKPIDATLVSGDDGVALEGRAAVESISVDDENIRPHLLAPDFFDVERNPEILFRSTQISGSADDLTVTGELSMAGATLLVEAKGRVRGPVSFGEGFEKLSLSLETTIDRTAFGMVWQMELPGGGQALANDVRLIVELELNKEAASTAAGLGEASLD
jgi:polyisoprenoid-binding protein YceI